MDKRITKEDMFAIDNDKAEFIGEGEWYKDSAYRVYKVEDRYIAVTVASQMNYELMTEYAEYITEEEIKDYI